MAHNLNAESKVRIELGPLGCRYICAQFMNCIAIVSTLDQQTKVYIYLKG